MSRLKHPWPDLAYRARLAEARANRAAFMAAMERNHVATLDHIKTCERCRGELKLRRDAGAQFSPEVLAVLGEAVN